MMNKKSKNRIALLLMLLGCIFISFFILTIATAIRKDTPQNYASTHTFSVQPTTFLDYYALAAQSAEQWDSRAYLSYAMGATDCDQVNDLPKQISFTFVYHYWYLLSTGTWLATIEVDAERQRVSLIASDLKDARPPDNHTDPYQLKVGFEEAVNQVVDRAAFQAYKANYDQCVMRMWLQNNKWEFTLSPAMNLYQDSLSMIIDGN